MFVCIDSGGNTQLTYIHTYICFCVASPAPSCVYKCVCVVTVWGHVCVLLIVNCKFVNLFATVIIIICLYAGMAGTLYFYVDMLANADSACFPALEV